MTILHRLLRISSGDTFYAAALFPLVGLLFAAFRVSETKVGVVAEAGAAASSTPTDVTLKAKHRSDPEMTTVETRRKPAWPRRDQREEGRVQRRESVKEGETNRGLGHDHGDEMAGVRKIEDDGGGGDEDVDRGLTFDSPGAAQGGVRSRVRKGTAESKVGERVKAARAPEVIPRAVMLLVGNGFLLMYAFSIETIYAMFLKVKSSKIPPPQKKRKRKKSLGNYVRARHTNVVALLLLQYFQCSCFYDVNSPRRREAS